MIYFQKGGGYHLDLFVLAIQMAISSVLGLPWFVAATVLSINHVRSLSRESKSAAPGERPKFLGVREQRLTGVVTFLMVGLSVLMTKVLSVRICFCFLSFHFSMEFLLNYLFI